MKKAAVNGPFGGVQSEKVNDRVNLCTPMGRAENLFADEGPSRPKSFPLRHQPAM
jgi:hypothetical protein